MATERNIIDFMDRVLPDHFQGQTWGSWRVVLKAAFGLPLDRYELAVFRALTGRTEVPTAPARELWAVVGRRGGKSQISALVATYLATCRTYPLAIGEQAVLPIVAADRRQARIVAGYVKGILHSTPILERLIERELRESVELSNGVTIEILTASGKTTRGYTCIGAVCDEIAFWPTDETAAEPDRAILDALRPAMSTIPGALLLCLSTPYARRGELHHAVEHHHGEDGDVMVIMADTRSMNPGVDRSVIDRAFKRDPIAAMSEYGREGAIEFRSDVSALLTDSAIQAVTPEGVTELSPDHFPKALKHAHFDAATGSGKDAAALAIACASGKGGAALLVVRHWRPPFSPAEVAREASELLSVYGLAEVQIDRYAVGLITELFSEHGVEARVSELDTSATFVSLLALVNSQRVRLLDHPALLSEVRRLERRSGSGGRDRVGHAPGGHDDVAAAAAGALMQAAKAPQDTSLVWGTRGRHFHPSLPRRRDRRWWGELLANRQQLGGTRGVVPDRLAPPPTGAPTDDPFSRENRFK